MENLNMNIMHDVSFQDKVHSYEILTEANHPCTKEPLDKSQHLSFKHSDNINEGMFYRINHPDTVTLIHISCVLHVRLRIMRTIFHGDMKRHV